MDNVKRLVQKQVGRKAHEARKDIQRAVRRFELGSFLRKIFFFIPWIERARDGVSRTVERQFAKVGLRSAMVILAGLAVVFSRLRSDESMAQAVQEE